MKNLLEGDSPAVRLAILLGLVSTLFAACAPTGAYEDNFGSFYSLVTVPFDPDNIFNGPYSTSGTVDTRAMGCGVWPITGESFRDSSGSFVLTFVADNPNKNPADLCCYNFRFEGERSGSNWALIFGTYEADFNYPKDGIERKCEQSGEMYLFSAP
jgi:hypothetical protein